MSSLIVSSTLHCLVYVTLEELIRTHSTEEVTTLLVSRSSLSSQKSNMIPEITFSFLSAPYFNVMRIVLKFPSSTMSYFVMYPSLTRMSAIAIFIFEAGTQTLFLESKRFLNQVFVFTLVKTNFREYLEDLELQSSLQTRA